MRLITGKVILDIAALGIPGLITVLLMKTTGLYGAAAFNTALKSIGKGNMYREFAILSFITIGMQRITEEAIDYLVISVVK